MATLYCHEYCLYFKGRNHPPVPILAVGPDTLAAHHLLRHASLLAQRCVTLSSPSHWGPLHGTAHHDEQGSSWLEAGALLLASTGVCFLGDWAKFKSTNMRSSILSGNLLSCSLTHSPLSLMQIKNVHSLSVI